MKIAYLDCFSGVSGDMLLGAFVGAGVEWSAIEEQIQSLGVAGVGGRTERVKRAGLMATRVVIVVPPQPPPRHYAEIVRLLQAAPLSARVKQQALAIFERLGRTEAALHGCPLEKVHFHELGAVDTLADIVGSCVAMELLGIEELHCSPLNLGSGTVRCEHGLLPVPAPATAALLQGIPVYSSGVEAELVTPTGAAILSTLAKGFGPLPAMRIEAIGYGAGARDLEGAPNVLRVLVGAPLAADAAPERIPERIEERLWMLEANLDDMNPQFCGFFAERAFAAGALDVFFAPVQMKKNRPGILLSVLCRPDERETLLDLFFQETTTLGVRSYEVFRRALEREWVSVATSYGEVRVKVSRRNGQVVNFSPEYEDCRRLAVETAAPLKRIVEEATAAFWKELGSEPRQ